MRHGEGFERAIANYRRRASGQLLHLGLPESGTGEIGGQTSKYPYRVFSKGLDADKAYSGTEIFELACLEAKKEEKWREADIEALMARLATTIHVNHRFRVDKEKSTKTIVDSTPAGYTYLAQFAIHDMTFSAPGDKVKGTANNLASPRLDLGTLYGDGHTTNNILFEHVGPGKPRARFRVGYMTDGSAEDDDSWIWNGEQLKRARQEDIPRIPLTPVCGYTERKNAHEPMLADTRNADNLILSQLTVLFMKFHNKLFDRLSETTKYRDDTNGAFEAAKGIVTGVYKSVIVNDLLWRLLDGQTWGRYFGDSPVQLPDERHVSREAAFAILRFGHSMVREKYDFSDGQPNAVLSQLLDFFGMPAYKGAQIGLPLDNSWIIDWRRFFDFKDSNAGNRAHLFGLAMNGILKIHSAVESVPSEELKLHSLGLAFRTLMKGIFHNLPTGQAVAAHMKDGGINVRILTAQQIADCLGKGKNYGAAFANLMVDENDLELLSRATPLFAYILAEAEILEHGVKLGSVGGDFVAYTFASGIGNSTGSSDWKMEWANCGFSTGPPSTMPDLVIHVQNGTDSTQPS